MRIYILKIYRLSSAEPTLDCLSYSSNESIYKLKSIADITIPCYTPFVILIYVDLTVPIW